MRCDRSYSPSTLDLIDETSVFQGIGDPYVAYVRYTLARREIDRMLEDENILRTRRPNCGIRPHIRELLHTVRTAGANLVAPHPQTPVFE